MTVKLSFRVREVSTLAYGMIPLMAEETPIARISRWFALRRSPSTRDDSRRHVSTFEAWGFGLGWAVGVGVLVWTILTGRGYW